MNPQAMTFPVRFEVAGQAVQTTSRELDERGIFVRCMELPPLRTAMKLTLYLPAGALELRATVRSIAGQPPGFWADFDERVPEVRARILSALASSLEQIGAPGSFDPTKPAEGRNRRVLPRTSERLRVRLDGAEAWTLNLSATGLFVLADPPPAADAIVRLELELPDGQPPAQVVGVVVRPAAAPESGAAVQFIHADDAFRERLDAHLAGHRASSDP